MAARDRVHRYAARCEWTGSTGAGYQQYDRTHVASAPPAVTELRLSADPAFRGDPACLNPEQLVVMAAASCQLLSFLAIAARGGVDVQAYADEAEAEMPVDDPSVRLTVIRLRPRISVAAGTDIEQVRRMVEQAHHACYVASSLRTNVLVEPAIVVLD